MSENSLLGRLIEYDRWANAQTRDSLVPVAGKAPKAVTLLAHIHTGWSAWMDRIEQTEREIIWFPEVGLDECEQLGEIAQSRWDSFLGGMPDNWPTAKYPAKLLDGRAAEFTLSEIVMQLVTHGSHHRGQINTLVCQAGGEPEYTTFMGYVLASKQS
jgi:uncharacterized damage-inducible protein DinB